MCFTLNLYLLVGFFTLLFHLAPVEQPSRKSGQYRKDACCHDHPVSLDTDYPLPFSIGPFLFPL